VVRRAETSERSQLFDGVVSPDPLRSFGGSDLGRYVAKVISWDFEVSAEDPIVTLELVALPPEALDEALARSHIPAA
jgi:hypothetical protein